MTSIKITAFVHTDAHDRRTATIRHIDHGEITRLTKRMKESESDFQKRIVRVVFTIGNIVDSWKTGDPSTLSKSSFKSLN